MDKKEINDNRGYYVVKSNELIQNSRYSLSLQQQRIILYLISKVQSEDEDFKLYEFKINDFCEVCGIEINNGKNFIDLKRAIKDLADISMWVHIDGGKRETLLRWIEKAYIDHGSGTIQIRLDNDMKPYLLHLKEKYTQYSLLHTLAMRSRYSIRLFELLRSYAYQNTWIETVDNLKILLDAETYSRFADFNRKVLKKAVEEINLYTDINVKMDSIKSGNTVTQIKFYIKVKENTEEKLDTVLSIREKLN